MSPEIRLLLALLLPVGCAAPEPAPVPDPPALEVTYVANEGFLIEAESDRILIDALFGEEPLEWCHTPTPEALAALESAEPPFDDIDLILVTHAHRDHFSAALTLSHLNANPLANVVAPWPAVKQLEELPDWSPEFAERVLSVGPELHDSVPLAIGGIELEVVRLRHGSYPEEDPLTGETRNRHEDVVQLAYVVTLGGLTFLHLGDAFIDQNREWFESGALLPGELDVLFLEGWTPESLEIVEEKLAPGHLVLMHLPGDPQQFAQIAGALAEGVPGGVIFEERMQTRRLERSRTIPECPPRPAASPTLAPTPRAPSPGSEIES